MAKRHAERIVHVHCKDIRGYALAAAQRRDVSFSAAVLEGSVHRARRRHRRLQIALRDPGQGDNYSGWLVQEAEQDPRIAHPLTYAELGCAHLKKLCAGGKLKLA